jgi:spoIIIJ-associated protein
MDYFEAEGRSIEEALESISRQHGISVEDLEYEIVENKRKILGILGKENVLVRAWPRSPSMKDPAEVLRELMSLAGISVDVRRVDDGDSSEGVRLELEGRDLGLVLRRNGEVLDAIQYLLNKMVNRRTQRPISITLDSSGFRERKQQRLREMALEAAEEARTHRKSVVLNPMSPRDRRIIHITLKDHQDITTRSIGEGYLKKVMISLKRPSNRSRRGT